ncbi:adenylyl-cyclase-associated protein [Theileria orientalis strain Shintoku]|uniref:Adenylyl-cyclase-associated protein n=1 Tax=Theileria orientalis strain Shintoku TaxID=869250 RepID=J4CDM7_THEOR|nr:adenylyl-cyclase-associated protein [Theileria orientalis strain Shintoku]BAM41412.1 adenylyl-cyclase-associated protein [Theileria orientalis strain Shintoku]|eukprot:XP_009691713.1 adenylyl-cyclase-associated protein [Theileria orientalis strain Shintoku]
MVPKTFELKGEVWNVCGYVDEVVDLSCVGRNQSSTLCECSNVKVTMPEKMISVSLISCKNVEVFVNSLISSMELTNCHNVKVRVKTTLPACSIDKSQQVSFWISRENASMIMFSSCKSGDMNVNINRNTSGNPDEDDWVEQPLPEQFEHSINENLKVVTKPSSLYP